VHDIIDIHPHVLCADQSAYPLAPLGGSVSGWASTRPVTAGQLLAEMDQAGIAKAALVQASTAYGYDNSYVLDSAARYPDRFAAVACADPLAPDAAQTVRKLAAYPRLAGIRLFTTGSTMPSQAQWLNDERTYPFWAAAADVGAPVCVQMRLAGRDQLTDILDRFPAARIVLDHMAYPPIAPGQERAAADQLIPLAKYPQLYLKMTIRNTEPLSGCDAQEFLGPLLGAFGPSRIAWGSNFPAAEQPLGTLVELARTVLGKLKESDRDAIFSGTARSLYPPLD
jgi:predicted TIM-barrel fold metal-dependent hydrolase